MTSRGAIRVVDVTLDGVSDGARATLCLGSGDPASLLASAALHAEETALLAGFAFERRREAFAMGRVCAKAALGAFLGRPDVSDLSVRSGELGQPYVQGASGVGISISHRDGYGAAVVFGEGCPLGLDIEPTLPTDHAHRPPFDEAEAHLLSRFESADLARAVLFTAKEALGKVMRTGLAVSPELLRVASVARNGDAYVCSFQHVLPFRATSLVVGDLVVTLAHPTSARVAVDLRALAPRTPRLPFVLMFSGQGSQYFHMGAKLYADSTVFRRWMDHADAYLQRTHGLRVLAHIHDKARTKAMTLGATEISNAAIVMIEVAVARALEEKGFLPEVVLGTSLGEIAACVTADVLDLEAGLDLAVQLARLVDGSAARGKMFAVLAPPEVVQGLALGPWEVAATFAGHFVASVLEHAAAAFSDGLLRAEIRFQDVGVEFPFHSAGVDAVREPFLHATKDLVWRAPRTRFVSCARAGSVDQLTPAHLWSAIRQRIAFRETIAALSAERTWTFIDAGPSGSLAGHVRQQLPETRAVATLTPFGHDDRSFAAAVDALHALRAAP